MKNNTYRLSISLNFKLRALSQSQCVKPFLPFPKGWPLRGFSLRHSAADEHTKVSAGSVCLARHHFLVLTSSTWTQELGSCSQIHEQTRHGLAPALPGLGRSQSLSNVQFKCFKAKCLLITRAERSDKPRFTSQWVLLGISRVVLRSDCAGRSKSLIQPLP